jgi:hypothetical protein
VYERSELGVGPIATLQCAKYHDVHRRNIHIQYNKCYNYRDKEVGIYDCGFNFCLCGESFGVSFTKSNRILKDKSF